MRTRKYAECRRQILVTRSVKPLRHDVRQHHSRLAVLKLDFTTLDFIADVMVLDVDMLGAAMVYRILRHLDARLIVFTDKELRSFLVGSHHNLTKKTMNTLTLLNRQAECDVLSFTC